MPRIDPRVHLPGIVTRWFAKATWRVGGDGKAAYLTFDDGPVPEMTPWVLDVLQKEGIKATFFCVGENVSRNPEIFKRIKEEGHSVGNHTFNHLQGLKTNEATFMNNIAKANELIGSDLFRPPYGWMTRRQYKSLLCNYKIIMWDILSRDFDQDISGEKVVKNVMDFVRPGSIIIFHDSVKAVRNLYYALPRVIGLLKEKGFSFRKLKSQYPQ
ncbi:MAG: polysaccharide deacetylase family protein [Chlorobi bacterium]|nr:polysaccharide deacetylase family protein [Chlorobiota bacterium]